MALPAVKIEDIRIILWKPLKAFSVVATTYDDVAGCTCVDCAPRAYAVLDSSGVAR